jgi:hypothetical protein
VRNKKNICRILVGKPQGKTPLGIHTHRQNGYIKTPPSSFSSSAYYFSAYSSSSFS